jgi:hypothetical protein
MKPLAIVVSFNVSEQVMPGSIPSFVASLVHKFGFDRAKAAFHRRIVPAISLPAHGLDHAGCIKDLAVISGGILAAAIRMMNEARRRFLPLDGHGKRCDGQFSPHVITHRPANDLPGEEIKHDSQIEPAFGGWHIAYIGEPDLVRPRSGKILSQPVGGNRKTVAAVRGAWSKPPRRYCPYAVMTHEPFDAAAACLVPQAA